MSRKRIYLTIVLFFLGLTFLRIGWINYHEIPEHPHAVKGHVDLSEWTFTDNETITLDGEWEFYPHEFLDPLAHQETSKQYITVPGNWVEDLHSTESIAPYGYGTYRLKLKVPSDSQEVYGLRMVEGSTASRIFVNGREVANQNNPVQTIDDYSTERGPYTALFHNENGEVELLIHLSNYDIPFFGGISNSIKIGTASAIIKESKRSASLQFTICIIYLLHSLYAFYFYFIARGKYQKEVFYYGLLLIVSGLSLLIDDDVVLQLPLPIEWTNMLLLFIFLTILFITIKFVQHLFEWKSSIYKMLTIFYILLVMGIVLVPYEIYPFFGAFIGLFYIVSLYVLFRETIKAIRSGYPDAIFILLFITSYTSNVIWGTAIILGFSNIPYYPFDFIIVILSIALLLILRHIRVVKMNDYQRSELQKTSQLKDEFLANTSHELRNPLHGINNIAHTMLLDENEPLSESNRESLELLLRIGKQMAFTLNDLLDSARMTEEDFRLDKTAVNLHSAASVSMDMVQLLVYGKDIELIMDIPHTFPTVEGDEHRLIQILFNLLHNAVKFTEEGTVSISATYTKDEATIFVRDTGIGMDAQVKDTVFDRYKQGNPSVTSTGGVGLGLSICKQLVELHGGTIWAKSTPGEGSTFTFTLPIATEVTGLEKPQITTIKEQVVEELTVTTKQEASLDASRILIVDDDPVNLLVLQKLLQKEYSLTTASSGKEALEKIEAATFDLVIVDVMMPGMSGYELTKTVRKSYTVAELPILLLTARSQPQDIITGFIAGANDYVSKPVDALSLQARVHSLTKLRESIKDQNKMEAAWLQAQIRPHFLFNTLNTIASLAEIDPDRMIKLQHEFGNYLRRSFATENVQDLVPLKDEIALIKSYLYIEQERFSDRLQVEWLVEEVDECFIPPLSIQTLVENAAVHGVLQREEGGKITIRIAAKTDAFEISIEDDGIGMTEAEVQRVLVPEAAIKKGIGIPNTDRRLKKLFGKGLNIQSSKGKGTVVWFEIPNRKS
ncbi:ATP-binding protein [Sporosarcina oncorhynchi]|uniref:histidine kinase n=1 Tax=Sporosarcina oncorhynchi TaxID=3056444 RepID=A0ABZ0L9F8_9BACL|nr:ATP-binding protein [Sporosarcina sp. T2O-4]WOV88099.1 ATP-binding protein [Sporosarcina sp. T2O-4]